MAVVFDCSSNMAMFRKPYTTTSSVSFAFPPPTAVAGLIGAIVGLDHAASRNASNSHYWDALSGTRIAVSIREPIKWLRAAVNFSNLKNPQQAPHIQVKHQFVASPKYRIYVKHGVEGILREKLERNSFVYTPYLGVAYALAQIDYVGFCNDAAVADDEVLLDTVLPLDAEVEIDIAKSAAVFKEIVPLQFTVERALMKSVTVLYACTKQRKLVLKKRGSADVTRCMDDTVAWFPAW